MTNKPTDALIGAPTDVGAGVRGVNLGPDALRIADIDKAIEQYGFTVIDRGNLQGPANPNQPPMNGYRHFDEVVAWNKMAHDAVYDELKNGNFPILMGGDHCLGLASLTAVARHCREQGKKLRILWLDAHADFNTSEMTPSGNIHGMPVACACGFGPDELTTIGGVKGAISPKDVYQIGIRSVDAKEKYFINEKGVTVFDMRYIDENGMRHTMEQALKDLDDDTHLHISFDVDFLDPSIAPAVGTTVMGGPTYREASLCMEMIADTGLMASLDIMELNPTLDERNRTAVIMVDFIESLFGKSTLVRPDTTQ